MIYIYNPSVTASHKWLIVSLFIFCFSLNLNSKLSVYGVQIFLLFALSVIMFYRSRFSVKISSIISFLAIAIFIIFITSIQSTYLNHQELLWLQVSRVIFWIMMCFISYPFLIKVHLQDVEKSLKIVIALFAISIFIQFLSFYIFNKAIDFSLLTGGEPSRMYGALFRPSGLTSEPAIYSGIMIGLLTLLYIINNLSWRYIFTGIASILLTMSVYGILSSFLFIFIVYLLNFKMSRLLVGGIIIGITILSTMPILIERYESYQSGQDHSNMTKVESFNNLLSNPNLTYLGYGFTGKSESAPSYYEGLYDVTAFGSPLILFGVPIGVLIVTGLCFFIWWIPFSFKEKMLVILSLSKLSSPTFLFFNLFLLLLLVISYQRRRRALLCH